MIEWAMKNPIKGTLLAIFLSGFLVAGGQIIHISDTPMSVGKVIINIDGNI